MAKIVTYSCPGAGAFDAHSFDFMHHPSDEPAPRYCPKCGFDSQADEVVPKIEFSQAIVSPHVRSGMAKARFDSANQTYRQMEAGGQEMADQASALSGENESHLKITNLKDNLQMGEAAAIDIPVNPVSELMKAKPETFGFQAGQAGSEWGKQAHTGMGANGMPIPKDTPYAGGKAKTVINQLHATHGHAMVKAGENGRFANAGRG